MCEGFIEKEYKLDVLCSISNYPLGDFFNGYFFKKKKEIHNKVKVNRVF